MALAQEIYDHLVRMLRGHGNATTVKNLLDNIEALSSVEAGYLDSVTAGTGAASKALVLDANGDVAMPTGGMIALSRASIAAAGADASGATVLTGQVNAVTGADNAKGVALPAAALTEGPIWVINTVANSSLLVYPVNGGNDNINGLAEDAAFTLAPGEAAMFTPVSATQWYTPDRAGVKAKELTTTYAVTVAENGMTYYLNSGTEFVSTLPAPFLGARYKFVVKAAPASASYTVVTTSSANIIKGVHLTAQDAGGSGDSGTADDTISFVDGQAVAGDWCEVISDGTSWFATACSKVQAGITFTQASA